MIIRNINNINDFLINEQKENIYFLKIKLILFIYLINILYNKLII